MVSKTAASIASFLVIAFIIVSPMFGVALRSALTEPVAAPVFTTAAQPGLLGRLFLAFGNFEIRS